MIKVIFKVKNSAPPSGITSLLLVIAMSLIFVVMIVGLTSLSIRESRQAVYNDLSSRALEAAESSARDAAQWIDSNPGKSYPQCDGSDTSGGLTQAQAGGLIQYKMDSSPTNPTSIVCRTVTLSTSTPTSTILRDQSTQIMTYLPNNTGVDSMSIAWSASSDLSVINIPNISAANLYPTLDSYWNNNNNNNNYPAALEISAIYWTRTTPITSDLPINTSIIMPSKTNCTTSLNTDGYYCHATINLNTLATNSPLSKNIVIRIRARYHKATYTAKFFYGPKPVMVQPANAHIDVTAKVGDLYRRITAEKPLSGLNRGNSYIDDVLYSDKNICKNLTVLGGALNSPNNCL